MTGTKRNSKNQSTNQNVKSLIYVGPTIKNLTRYTLFSNGYPQIYQQHKDNCPSLTSMFIEPNKLPEFERKFSNQNSVESVLYRNVEKYFSENGVK